HERVPYLGLAIVAFFVPLLTKSAALLLTFLMLIWQGIGAGLAANPWTSMVSKVMPRELHGTFFGTQSAAFNAMGGLSAVMAGLILDRLALPVNYSLCFALTFASMIVSYIFLSMTREPEGTQPEPEHATGYLKKSLEIWKREPNFRAFIGVRILSQF